MMTTSTTPPPGPGLQEGPPTRVSTTRPVAGPRRAGRGGPRRGVPVLGTIDVLGPVAAALGVLLLLAGPGYCVVVAAGFRNVGLRLAVTLAVSLGTIVLLATMPALPRAVEHHRLLVRASGSSRCCSPRPPFPRRARRADRPPVRAARGRARRPRPAGRPAGPRRPGGAGSRRDEPAGRPGIAATPQTTTARLWSVGRQWWALVWDEASGSYTFQRRTTDGGRWQYAGLTVEAARGDAIDVLWNGTRLVVVVAGSASDGRARRAAGARVRAERRRVELGEGHRAAGPGRRGRDHLAQPGEGRRRPCLGVLRPGRPGLGHPHRHRGPRRAGPTPCRSPPAPRTG